MTTPLYVQEAAKDRCKWNAIKTWLHYFFNAGIMGDILHHQSHVHILCNKSIY